MASYFGIRLRLIIYILGTALWRQYKTKECSSRTKVTIIKTLQLCLGRPPNPDFPPINLSSSTISIRNLLITIVLPRFNLAQSRRPCTTMTFCGMIDRGRGSYNTERERERELRKRKEFKFGWKNRRLHRDSHVCL